MNQRISSARSVLGLLLLCASLGSVVDIEVSGDDEDDALATLTSVLERGDFDSSTNAEIVYHPTDRFN